MSPTKFHTIAPIVPEYINRHLFEISFGDVKIIPKPDLLNKKEIIDHLSLSDKMQLEVTELVFISEYEASALGEVDPAWKGPSSRSKQDSAYEKIQLCNLALWISYPTSLVTTLFLHILVDDTRQFTHQSGSIDPVLPHLDDKNNFHTKESFETAQKINLAILSIERKNSLWLSIMSLLQALTSNALEVRFILLWVALEALYGSETEISYRISHRIAFFISEDRKNAKEEFLRMKTSYNFRSQIVHGLRIRKNKQDNSMEILKNTETSLRKSLSKILLDKKYIEIFNHEDKRKEFLDDLIFS